MFSFLNDYDEFNSILTLGLVNNWVMDSEGWVVDLLYMHDFSGLTGALNICLRNKINDKHLFNPYDKLNVSVDLEVHSLKNSLFYDKDKTPANKYYLTSALFAIKLEILTILYSDKNINFGFNTNRGFQKFTLPIENKYCLKAFHDHFGNMLISQ